MAAGALVAAVLRALRDVGVTQCHRLRMCLGLFSRENGSRLLGMNFPRGGIGATSRALG